MECKAARVDGLQVDRIYRNTNNPNHPEDVFNRFFRFRDQKGINNTSGFRAKCKAGGSTDIEDCAFCVLVTNFGEVEWPDTVDLERGLFTYYGDNRRLGGELHQTAVGGNRLLARVFGGLHTGQRESIPPFLVFEKFKSPGQTHMRFLGIAAPGAQGASAFTDLVAVWRVVENRRFQNYRSLFTLLKEDAVKRSWLEDLVDGLPPAASKHCPASWRRWVESGLYTPLTCERKREPRRRREQLPRSDEEKSVLEKVMSGLTDREFEFAAAAIVQLMDERFADFTVTPRVRDRGRDAIGLYRVGHDNHQVHLHAIVEAKFWRPTADVGVEPMARLISRLKHRDIGVFVTTSCFNTQVQEELIEDSHPVILISGGDIARLLIAHELNVPEKLEAWLALIRQQAAEVVTVG